MPDVTVPINSFPKGLPIAITVSPTLSVSESLIQLHQGFWSHLLLLIQPNPDFHQSLLLVPQLQYYY